VLSGCISKRLTHPRSPSTESTDSMTLSGQVLKKFYRQFQAAMLFKDSALLDRIFRVVDVDDDDQISFSEYLSCLSTISNKASQDDKLKCIFVSMKLPCIVIRYFF
jgi:Ca2+-binding EF-hand superfamily protein